MQFPTRWEFISPDDFEAFSFRPMETRHAGIEVVTSFEGGRFGDFRVTTGGNRILSAKFQAETILGPKFSGEYHTYIRIKRRPNRTIKSSQLMAIKSCKP